MKIQLEFAHRLMLRCPLNDIILINKKLKSIGYRITPYHISGDNTQGYEIAITNFDMNSGNTGVVCHANIDYSDERIDFTTDDIDVFIALCHCTKGDFAIPGEYYISDTERVNRYVVNKTDRIKQPVWKIPLRYLINHLTKKPMSEKEKVYSVKITDFAKIIAVSCSNWYPQLCDYLRDNRGNSLNTISVSYEYVNAMYGGATVSQKAIIHAVFPEYQKDKVKLYSIEDAVLLVGLIIRYETGLSYYNITSVCQTGVTVGGQNISWTELYDKFRTVDGKRLCHEA